MYSFSVIAYNQVEDVREVLSYYREYEDPLAKFRENQQILLVSKTNVRVVDIVSHVCL